MFIGHYAPALIAATRPKGLRLGPLFLAAQLVDIALFLLVPLGIEHLSITPGITAMSALDLWDGRWTHSLVATVGWAAGFAIAVKLMTRNARAAWIGGAVVLSHWFLDLIVHPPDLTIAGAGERHGLGLWNHPYLAMPLELLLAFTAFAFYLNHSRACDWRGQWAPVALAVAAVAFQVVDWLRPATADAIAAPWSVSPTTLATLTILTVLAWWTGDARDPAVRTGSRS